MNSPLYLMLKRLGPTTTPVLAKHLKKEPGAVNRDLQTLVKKGLVEKQGLVEDGVVVHMRQVRRVVKVNKWAIIEPEVTDDGG